MIEGLRPYPTYKPIDSSWLANCPSHWEVRPAFGAYMPVLDKNSKLEEKTVLSLSYGRIIIKPEEKLRGLVPSSFRTYQIINPGDIVIRPTDLQNDHTSLRVGMAKDRGIITSAYLALRTRTGMQPSFGYQFLNVWDLTKAIYGYGSGLRQNLDFVHFKRMPVVLPPGDEQDAIVRFLNHANAKIERAIQAKKRLIALLNEKKQEIIRHAVTRGLDASIPLKPSGIRWIGDIPAGWDVIRAKYLFREVDERSVTGDEDLLSVSHITGVTPRSEKNITMFKARSYVGHKLCKAGDLVVNTMWGWMGAMGVSRYPGIVSPSYAVYRPLKNSKVVGSYMDNLLRSKPYIWNYTVRSTGVRSSRLRLYPEEFLKLRIILPPPPQQDAVSKWIEQQTESQNYALTQANREIELLREYRTRLTADVVTGKLDVREVARNLPDIVEEIPIIKDDEELEAETEESEQEAA